MVLHGKKANIKIIAVENVELLEIGGNKMGQQEVMDFLNKHKGKWFSVRDIAENINVGTTSVARCLHRIGATINQKVINNKKVVMIKGDK